MLEEILDHRNIERALKRVISNKGAGGVDGMQTDELRDYLKDHWPDLKSGILSGHYRPPTNVLLETMEDNQRAIQTPYKTGCRKA